ncbi:MAG: hypothetical protein L6R36_006221 [Xanthoria steineri]|nr:MAG: hypothetical protein L6R36_006221 [Xanthoria steineri]
MSAIMPPVLTPDVLMEESRATKSNPPVDFSHFQLLHDVFKIRSADPIQVPLLAFPRSRADDFEYFTADVLERFTSSAAWFYAHAKLSTAMVNLMQETDCRCLVYYASPQLRPVVDQVQLAMDVTLLSMMPRSDYDVPKDGLRPFVRDFDVLEEKERNAAIVHSSGSTGLPQPIYYKHTRFTQPYQVGVGDRHLFTLPLYHAFAIQVSFAHMYQRKTVFFLNENLPMTCETVTLAIQAAKPSTVGAVPYILKILGERQSGVDALRSCGQVLFTGSQCPDELGDYLVEQGVNLATFLGSSECGYIGSSLGRDVEDKAWNYIRVPPPLMKNIWPKPITTDAFEFVYLREYPSRTVVNSDDPPDSFHSKDLFEPHKSISGAWKYLGRLDDRITLINGEKVLPLPIEGRIRKSALVKEAVVFGVGKSIPGLLLFRAEAARGLSDEAFVSSVWPEIETANTVAEGFSQIDRNMVVPMPYGIEIPTTDKGSIIRARLYDSYQREIAHAYDSLECHPGGAMKLSLQDLTTYLLQVAQKVVGPQVANPAHDLFTLGMNSLQAIQMRGNIVRDLDLGGNIDKLGQNVVYEQGNLENLANYLDNLRHNVDNAAKKPVQAMEKLISKFSVIPKPRSGIADTPKDCTVALTGATGGLGAHILAQLLDRPNVSKVYCLLRGADGVERLQRTFEHNQLTIHAEDKICVLTCELSAPKLGLDDASYTHLASQVTHVIHCAWPVNFQLALTAFEPSIQGLQNLLQLSLDVGFAKPARFLFCSSIAAVLGSSPDASIPEAPVLDLAQASDTGYGQSKLVSERIVQAAVQDAGANASVLRIGQVVGGTKSGWWNDKEMVPMIIRSALTMGVLPDLMSTCEWLPVDTAAHSIIQIAGIEPSRDWTAENNATTHLENSTNQPLVAPAYPGLVYNLISPHAFSWTNDLLPALSAAGISFRPVSLATWIHRLRNLSLTEPGDKAISAAAAAADPGRNPAIKLVDFIERSYQTDDAARTSGVKFETKETRRVAPALEQAPKVIESGLLAKMVEAWLQRWVPEDSRKGAGLR